MEDKLPVKVGKIKESKKGSERQEKLHHKQ